VKFITLVVRFEVFVAVLRLLATADVVPSSPIFVSLMMEAIRSSETLILTAPLRNIPEDGILHSQRRVNL
jgi:hypothetical protein